MRNFSYFQIFLVFFLPYFGNLSFLIFDHLLNFQNIETLHFLFLLFFLGKKCGKYGENLSDNNDPNQHSEPLARLLAVLTSPALKHATTIHVECDGVGRVNLWSVGACFMPGIPQRVKHACCVINLSIFMRSSKTERQVLGLL